MYWFRDGNLLGFLPFALTFLLWTLGGWLMARHVFRLPANQRLLVGFGLGLVAYLWILNLIGGCFEVHWAYFLPAVLVFGFGILSAWKSDEPFLDWEDLKLPPFLLVFAVLFVYSVFLERGLGIYDDYHHLPAISAMAAGNLPPRYMLNATYEYSYHYGFELLGGSLMRLGNLFPWSAFDVGKAIVWVYSLVLVSLLLKQYLENTWKVFIGLVLFLFLGGTRYLMMLLPASVLQTFDPIISFRRQPGFEFAVFQNPFCPLDGGRWTASTVYLWFRQQFKFRIYPQPHGRISPGADYPCPALVPGG